MQKIRMFLGIPSTGTRSDFQGYVLRALEERYSDRIEFVYPKECVIRIFHDFARNGVVEEFLESGADVLWFLDSDVVPPKYVLDLITKHWDKWQVAGAPYPVFMHPPGEVAPQVLFTVYKGSNGKGMAPCDIPPTGTDFVDGLATGCLFIKKDVFSLLTKPYFEFKYDKETRSMTEGEDLGFCLKLQSLGIKFFTDYSMVCKHYKNVCLLDVNDYAMEYAKKSVAAYDRGIKVHIEKLASQVRGKMSPNLSPTSSQLIVPPSSLGIRSPR